ncbi:MAG: nitrite/sulfite reductase [Planctomycetaceae bacterium]|nr:nitrite/sulfite reductase [Planctomycetaceae bacterium]
MENDFAKDVFPCSSMDAAPARLRLAGLYPQRQEGLWMQRIKILGGRLSGAQWRALADLAERFTPDAPLHLTTRQDIEFHNVPAADVPDLQAALVAAGFTGAGACGDTVRNITVDPASGALDGSVDLEPLAWQIRRLLEDAPGVGELPRKFKISLSSSDLADAQPFINDLGFIAVRNGAGERGFRVIAAGSLGALPATGIEFRPFLPAADVLPLTAAALELFAAEGDRTNRRKARLRHVRQRLGDEAFKAALTERFEKLAASREFEWPPMPVAATGLRAERSLCFAGGDVSPAQARALGELADGGQCLVRLGNQHRVVVFAADRSSLLQALGRQEVLAAAMNEPAAIIACPGTRWCSHGLTDTVAAAAAIRDALGARLEQGTTVGISGCPNGCSHSAVAEIGLVGGRCDGADAYTLTVGGGMGRSDQLGRELGRKLTVAQVVEEIARHLDSSRPPG